MARTAAGTVEVEVIAPILGSFDHCQHCQVFIDSAGVGGQVHRGDLASYPVDVLDDFRRLSDLVFDLAERHGSRIVIRVVDPGSLRGMWTGIRRHVRRYPTFIVDGTERIEGFESSAVDEAIAARLAARAPVA